MIVYITQQDIEDHYEALRKMFSLPPEVEIRIAIEAPILPCDANNVLDARIFRELKERNDKLSLIKLVREVSGCSLLDAKNATDLLLRDR